MPVGPSLTREAEPQEGKRTPERSPRNAPGWFYRVVYRLLWTLCNAAFRVYFRLRVENSPTLRGPCVLVANHTSYLDPLLLGAAMMTPIELFTSISAVT